MSRKSDRMLQWYEDPEEADKWGAKMVDRGLFPTESHLIDRHFPKQRRLLNIGCGGGREAVALSDRYDVTAVDFSWHFCRSCANALKSKGKKAATMRMNAVGLALADDSFDCVVMVGQLIGQIRGRKNRLRALGEIKRVLKPKGVALVSTNSIDAGLRYRVWFFFANRIRRIYNPHNLEPDDAFVFHQGGKSLLFADKSQRPVFHWYRKSTFIEDAEKSGLECALSLAAPEFEQGQNLREKPEANETYYILRSK